MLPTVMKYPPLSLLTAGLLLAPAGLPGSFAADLYSEPFDSEATAKIGSSNGTGMIVSYVDYSGVTVGALLHNIPEAPRKIAGSASTRGVLIQVNYPAAPAATERIANLIALDDVGGSRVLFPDNYRVKCDVYLRLSPAVTLSPTSGLPTNTGTTEQFLWGVGYNATLPMGRGWRTGRGSGVWGWLATEGGHSATVPISDAALWTDGSGVASRDMSLTSADLAAYFTPAFGADASPVPHCPANQWVEATISVLGGQVTVEYQAVGRAKTKFFENVAGSVAGGVMVGYEDSFSSNSFDPDNQWLLLDNLVVEDLTPPTMVVNSSSSVVTFTGAPTIGTFTVSNAQIAGDLTISALNFTGTHAADFSAATPLPLVIPAGSSAPLSIQFSPAAPNGIKSASMTIVSNDPQQPNYVVGDIRARRSVGSFLMAHYKLDETEGTSAVDASGNNANAGFQIRDPLAFAKPSLLGAGGGTAIGFLPAQTGTTGNYFVSNITHVPTYSISLWMKPEAAGATRTLFERHESFAAPYEKLFGLLLAADGTLKYRVNNIDEMTYGPAIADGETWHIVLTHFDEDGFGNATAKRSRLYVNGLKVAERLDGNGFGDYSLSPTAPGLYVGSRTAAGFGFQGDLDDVQIYGAELTPEQVYDLYKRPGVTALQSPAFAISNAGFSGNPAKFGVEFPSNPTQTYSLQRSGDLLTWEFVLENAAAHPTNPTSVLEDVLPAPGKRFYRVIRD